MRKKPTAHGKSASKSVAKAGSRRRRGGRGGGRGGGSSAGGGARGAAGHELTSHPTTRGAQTDTRAWLLRHYGSSCAYCGIKVPARAITLDHVAPRRGKTAFDRRDNLVLACRDCNAKKRDQPPLAFLLAVKSRAVNLLRYGAHLSAGLLELARQLVPADDGADAAAHQPQQPHRVRWNAADDDDGPSPYRDG
ncbi:MAG TPA: HNH endonuclease signature motif containing protein [Gemmatimonadaceae bacterium]|jgi:hypothetical protein|nr:HNH endonuclease signature motif containing protein [Gemmatimonadaceae bacterium]